jgi:hypothetical protein
MQASKLYTKHVSKMSQDPIAKSGDDDGPAGFLTKYSPERIHS